LAVGRNTHQAAKCHQQRHQYREDQMNTRSASSALQWIIVTDLFRCIGRGSVP
jgi:hypothetical protein